MAIITRWRIPPESSKGNVPSPARIGYLHIRQQRDRPGARLAGREGTMLTNNVDHLLADPPRGIQRGHRS